MRAVPEVIHMALLDRTPVKVGCRALKRQQVREIDSEVAVLVVLLGQGEALCVIAVIAHFSCQIQEEAHELPHPTLERPVLKAKEELDNPCRNSRIRQPYHRPRALFDVLLGQIRHHHQKIPRSYRTDVVDVLLDIPAPSEAQTVSTVGHWCGSMALGLSGATKKLSKGKSSSLFLAHETDDIASHRRVASNGTRFVTDADLVKIINELNRFLTATSQHIVRAAIAAMHAWILDMEDVTITRGIQQGIVSQQVLPALTTFLSPQNNRVRRAQNLPDYIEEELTVLERKWGRGDFDGDVKRGLLVRTVTDVNGLLKTAGYRVDTNWPFYTSALYFGAGALVNGQIWESRVELMRDGVHAPPQAGISGTVMCGAYSVLLGSFDERNNLGYADIDMGEVIEYVGTALKDQDGLGPSNIKDLHMSIPGAWDQNGTVQPTAGTRALFKSLETGEPVRVIRSFKMCKIVTNKPTKGYRYDGLYRVVRATAMKEARQI